MRCHVVAVAEIGGGYTLYASECEVLAANEIAATLDYVSAVGIEPGVSYVVETSGDVSVCVVGVGDQAHYPFDLQPCTQFVRSRPGLDIFVHAVGVLGMTHAALSEYVVQLVGTLNVYVVCEEAELREVALAKHCVPLGKAMDFLATTKSTDSGFRLSDVIKDRIVRFNDEAYTRSLGCYHPSSVAQSSCDRALAYERLGVVPKAIFQGYSHNYFQAGHVIHGIVQRWLEEELGGAIENEARISIPELHIEGNADSIYQRNQFISDIKTVSAKEYEALNKARTKDVRQLTIYQLARACPEGSVMFVNRDTLNRKERYAPFMQVHAQWVIDRVTNIEEEILAGNLPEKETSGCADCKFKFICSPAVA